VATPFLRLAGARVEPKNHSKHDTPGGYGITPCARGFVIWLVLAWGLGFYFHHFGELKFARFFGFLAAPAAFMIWLYCSATAILLGAEINSRLRTAKA
jgi:hypothetical protein